MGVEVRGSVQRAAEEREAEALWVARGAALKVAVPADGRATVGVVREASREVSTVAAVMVPMARLKTGMEKKKQRQGCLFL